MTGYARERALTLAARSPRPMVVWECLAPPQWHVLEPGSLPYPRNWPWRQMWPIERDDV